MPNPSASEILTDFDNLVASAGRPLRFKYFTLSGADSGYDDEVTLSKSGSDIWVSGVIQPVRGKWGSSEASLMEQGLITHNDYRVWVRGSHDTSGLWTVMLGSPTASEYRLVNEGGAGVRAWSHEDTTVYKQFWVRYLTNGSLITE